MATQLDLKIPQGQLTALLTTWGNVHDKLAAIQPTLALVMSQDNGQAKVKTFAGGANGDFLRQLVAMRNELNEFFDSVGWRDE